jgi:hypothetical protein
MFLSDILVFLWDYCPGGSSVGLDNLCMVMTSSAALRGFVRKCDQRRSSAGFRLDRRLSFNLG